LTSLSRRCLSVEPALANSQAVRRAPEVFDTPKFILDTPSRINITPTFGEHLHELEALPSPPPSAALSSAKIAALHARLYLPSTFPFQTLARCLVDKTADVDPRFNNAGLAEIGRAQLGYLMTEWLVCKYPRLPTSILFMAQEAYLGLRAMEDLVRGWGVDPVAAPGGEVEPGLLQFKRSSGSTPVYEPGYHMKRRMEEKQRLLPEQLRAQSVTVEGQVGRPKEEYHSLSSSAKVMTSNQFGVDPEPELSTTTVDTASTNFVLALAGALYLHLGRSAVKTFFKDHILSRNLDISKLFTFKVPNRDLLLLCRREGFETPVPRLISETGRLSSHPVFVVGVYSGLDKLGEGAGGSIKEAKTRAMVAALKGWYLYSPVEFVKPSEVESVTSGTKKWVPNLVDCGEVIT
jgi:dsRNA-specific ribonuclease